ncbi:MAG: hypothetical protein Q9209_000753 [Squamulea sp. 1 TL-2023]
MSLSNSYSEIYALAGKARAKFVGQVNAKDQRLRLLVAHAKLYDCLDEHVENMRKRRRTRPCDDTFCIRVVNVPNPHDPCKIKQQTYSPQDASKNESTGGLSAISDCAVERASDDNENINKLSKAPNSKDSFPVQELDSTEDAKIAYSIHGTPSVITEPKTYSLRNPSDSPWQTIISETVIDCSSDSDSDSDSDSNSDFDGDLDPEELSYYRQTMKADPAPIARPPTPKPLTRREDTSDDRHEILDTVAHEISTHENLTNLQSVSYSIKLPNKDALQRDPNTKASTAALRIPLPLSPLLCDKGTDVSAAIHQDHRLQEALRHLLASSQKDDKETSAIASVLSCVFSSFPTWAWRREKLRACEEVTDEKAMV